MSDLHLFSVKPKKLITTEIEILSLISLKEKEIFLLKVNVQYESINAYTHVNKKQVTIELLIIFTVREINIFWDAISENMTSSHDWWEPEIVDDGDSWHTSATLPSFKVLYNMSFPSDTNILLACSFRIFRYCTYHNQQTMN